MASKNVILLTDATFDTEVTQSSVPVLVDFYADWCAPCRMMFPVVDELADTYVGKAKVCKLDTDANRLAPTQFGIQGIPTLIVFKGGQEFKRFTGVTAKSELKKALDEAS